MLNIPDSRLRRREICSSSYSGKVLMRAKQKAISLTQSSRIKCLLGWHLPTWSSRHGLVQHKLVSITDGALSLRSHEHAQNVHILLIGNRPLGRVAGGVAVVQTYHFFRPLDRPLHIRRKEQILISRIQIARGRSEHPRGQSVVLKLAGVGLRIQLFQQPAIPLIHSGFVLWLRNVHCAERRSVHILSAFPHHPRLELFFRMRSHTVLHSEDRRIRL